ncbi:hypothetical protein C8F01DRAFT_1242678 [Mycena amicta]|nr:hypothetical protein C8F01DRAFT_1242678 [Mycena amicta]
MTAALTGSRTATQTARKPSSIAQRRAASKYREKNVDELREKARQRMARLRARVAADKTLAGEAQERAREASAKYRRGHAEEVSTRAKQKRERLWCRKHGADAYVARLIEYQSRGQNPE